MRLENVITSDKVTAETLFEEGALSDLLCEG